MNKPIIIGGVDVSECEFFQSEDEEYTCKAEEGAECAVVACRSCYNCYYKQLQRLKAENERLKAFKRECLKPVYLPDIEPEVINKYKQALEEIRDCINVLSTVDNDFKGSIVEWKINKIINEVLKSENH